MKKINIVFLFLILSFVLKAQTKILFNATKAETAGSADWVIDADLHNLGYSNGPPVAGQGSESNPQRIPTPAQSSVTSSTAETYWNGGISAWGIDLVKKGYTVETLPYNGAITYGNATNAQDLSNYKVFIDCEPNILYTTAEKTAIMQFVQNGGGLFMVSDHNGSDRNSDGSDSPAIWNDLMSNNGILANPFGIAFDLVDFSQTTTNIPSLPADPILHGIMGDVTSAMWSDGTSMTLSPSANSSVKGIIYKTGSAFGNSNVMFAYASYGNGKIAAIGDSSPCDDGSGDSGDVLYNGWTGDAGGNHERLIINATIWLAASSQLLPTVVTLAATSIAPTSATLNGSVNPNGAATNWHFEWGTTTIYGNSTPAVSAGSGTTVISVSSGISGLIPGTTYHLRLTGVNSAGTSYGSDLTFTPGAIAITTTPVSYITTTGAVSGGTITSDGGASVIARGVCWSGSLNPVVTGSHTSDGSGTGSFASTLAGLTPNTIYHVRAYATNASGTYYGADIQFTTTCSNYTLPFTESFSTTTLPGCWSQTDHQGNGEVWAFGTITGLTPLPALTGNYAYLNSDGYGSGNSQNADLVSPSLDCSGFTTVNLAFNHYFRYYTGSSGTVSYSIDNGSTWTTIATFTATSSNPASFSQAVNATASQPQVKFKWNYTGTWGYYWGIDDIHITGTPCTTLPVSISIAASSNPVCAGTSVTFTATPANGGTTPVYQWKVNGATVGTNNPVYSYTPVNLDIVTCILTSNVYCSTGNPATSNPITMTVSPVLSVNVSVNVSSNPDCTGAPVTFTATPVNGGTNPGYQWRLNGLNTGTNSPSFVYIPVNNDVVNCILNSNAVCVTGSPATSNQIVMSSFLLVPTITGPVTACLGNAAVTYSTESNMTGYIWTLPVGGQLVSGAGTNTVSVTWNASGVQTIGVTYGNSAGCHALVPTVLNVNVIPSPVQAGNISGPSTVCEGTRGVVYSVDTIPNTSAYLWSVPPGVTITMGAGTQSIMVNFADSLFSGEISVAGSNTCSTGVPSPGFQVTSDGVLTSQVTLENISVPPSRQECHSGQSITTAGSGTYFTIEPGGEVTLIASELVQLLPGTTVQPSGLLNASITDQCVPCGTLTIPVPGQKLQATKKPGEVYAGHPAQAVFSVYPNPTNGSFTIGCSMDSVQVPIRAEIYNSMGHFLFAAEQPGEHRRVFSISDRPAGIYFIRIISGNRSETIKIMKQ